jgi:hypothetical protein
MDHKTSPEPKLMSFRPLVIPIMALLIVMLAILAFAFMGYTQ